MVETNPQNPCTPEEIVEFADELWRNEPIRAAIATAGPASFLDEASVRAIDALLQHEPGQGWGWRRENMLLAEAVIRRVNTGQFTGLTDTSIIAFLLDRMIPDLRVYSGQSKPSKGPGRISPATFEEMMDFSRTVRNDLDIWTAVISDPGGDLAQDETNTRLSNYERGYRRAQGMPNRSGFGGGIALLRSFAERDPNVDVESQEFQDGIRKKAASILKGVMY